MLHALCGLQPFLYAVLGGSFRHAGPSKAWDMCDICKRFTLDVISGWGFGTQFDVSAACFLSLLYLLVLASMPQPPPTACQPLISTCLPPQSLYAIL